MAALLTALRDSVIESATVFILGAGAHCSYGMPSGHELKKLCVQQAETMAVTPEYRNPLLGESGLSEANVTQQCQGFARALDRAGQPSIDAFLEANRAQAGYQVIGRQAIAKVLADKYKVARSAASDDDWIKYLVEIMLDGARTPDDFRKNKVSFVTFNYDLLLESRLSTIMQNSYGLNAVASQELLQQFPIVHVYGTLGAAAEESTDWRVTWRGIQTIYDAANDVAVAQAKQLLGSAKTICLLGFGFHAENIALLDLRAYMDAARKLGASRYGITENELERLTRPLAPHRPRSAYESHRCRDALRFLPLF